MDKYRAEAGLDPYYFSREHDGSGWSVGGPNGFRLIKADGPMDKSVAYIIAKLLSNKPDEAIDMLTDYARITRKIAAGEL